jgi:periplasmic divalent cation tolerance protein
MTAAIASVYATFADAQEAERIARAAIDERLAACVNILGPCRSIYRWQGVVEGAEEVAAIFKTSADTAPALADRIRALHSYDVPAVAIWPIAASSADYQAWVYEQVL